MNTDQLFTVEEALVRLGQLRNAGCLLVYNPRESVHIFVKEGHIICALTGVKQGLAAVDRALELEGTAYLWIPAIDPVLTNMRENIQEYVLRNAVGRDVKIGKTGGQQAVKTSHMPSASSIRKEAPEKTAYLYYLTSDRSHTRFELSRPLNVVGREETCDIIIEAPEISRKHCLIRVMDGGVLVTDLDSANGTQVNGARPTNSLANVGDRITLGPYELMIHREKA